MKAEGAGEPQPHLEASLRAPVDRSRRWLAKALPRLRPYLPVLIVVAVVVPVYDSVAWLEPTVVIAALRALRPEWLAVAAVLTATNIAVMGLYDVVGFRQTRATWGRRWFNGAVAFVWSNFLSFGPVAGPSVRFWLYRDSVNELGSLRNGVILVSVAFGSGLAGWGLGLGLAAALPEVLRACAGPVIALACTMLAAFAVTTALTRLRVIQSKVSAGSTLALAALGWLDWGLAWAVFAACLLAADAGAAIPGSWRVFLLGQVLGLASLVPGGFGGGDAYWILHLAGPAPALVCAVLAFRVLYYVVPWALGSMAVLSTAVAPSHHASLLASDPAR